MYYYNIDENINPENKQEVLFKYTTKTIIIKMKQNFWIFVLLASIVGLIASAVGVLLSLVNNLALFAGSLAACALFGILICLAVNKV